MAEAKLKPDFQNDDETKDSERNLEGLGVPHRTRTPATGVAPG
jgi:hypothetical protein